VTVPYKKVEIIEKWAQHAARPTKAMMMNHPERPVNDAERPGDRGGVYQLIDRPWALVGVLFFVTLALGIPLIWMSRAFSVPMKLLLTIAITVYTAVVFWGFWVVMSWAYHRVMDSL
jgi:hypothetical protein